MFRHFHLIYPYLLLLVWNITFKQKLILISWPSILQLCLVQLVDTSVDIARSDNQKKKKTHTLLSSRFANNTIHHPFQIVTTIEITDIVALQNG
jgi:hypothetical protein